MALQCVQSNYHCGTKPDPWRAAGDRWDQGSRDLRSMESCSDSSSYYNCYYYPVTFYGQTQSQPLPRATNATSNLYWGTSTPGCSLLPCTGGPMAATAASHAAETEPAVQGTAALAGGWNSFANTASFSSLEHGLSQRNEFGVPGCNRSSASAVTDRQHCDIARFSVNASQDPSLKPGQPGFGAGYSSCGALDTYECKAVEGQGQAWEFAAEVLDDTNLDIDADLLHLQRGAQWLSSQKTVSWTNGHSGTDTDTTLTLELDLEGVFQSWAKSGPVSV